MTQYIISPQASLDLSEIIDYFAIRNIEAGERFNDNVKKDNANTGLFTRLEKNLSSP